MSTITPPQQRTKPDFGARSEELHDYLVANAGSYTGDANAVAAAIDKWSSGPDRHMMTFKGPKVDIANKELEKLSPPPRVIVELGGFVGRSAIGWGAALKNIHGDNLEGCKVYCLELNEQWAANIREHVRIAGLDGLVEVVTGVSEHSLKKLTQGGTLSTIDVLFLDHWEKYYVSDTMLCEDLGLFHVGSIVLADNTDMPGAPDYLEYMRAGGRGGEGSVKYQTTTYTASAARGPTALEVSVVTAVP